MKPRTHGGGAEDQTERWRIMLYYLSPYLLFSTIWSAIIKAVSNTVILFCCSFISPHSHIFREAIPGSFSPDTDFVTSLPSGKVNRLI